MKDIVKTIRTIPRNRLIALAVFFILTLWFCFGFLRGLLFQSNAQSESSSKAYIPLVETIDSKGIEKVKEISLYGTTKSYRKVDIIAEISGKIENIPAKKGSFIHKGDLIAILDQKDLIAKLAKADALITQKRIESNAAEKLAKEGYQSATKAAAAFAELKSAEADKIAIENDISHTKITAPFDGILEDITVEIGTQVKSLDTKIATIVDYKPLVVVGYAPEKEAKFLTLGSSAEVKLINGDSLYGYISYVSSVADSTTRTFKVEAEIVNYDIMPMEGMSVELVLPLYKKISHNISPAYLSLNSKGELGIKILTKDNIVKFYPAEIIDEDNGYWISGLPDEATIITSGQGFLTDGDKAMPKQTN